MACGVAMKGGRPRPAHDAMCPRPSLRSPQQTPATSSSANTRAVRPSAQVLQGGPGRCKRHYSAGQGRRGERRKGTGKMVGGYFGTPTFSLRGAADTRKLTAEVAHAQPFFAAAGVDVRERLPMLRGASTVWCSSSSGTHSTWRRERPPQDRTPTNNARPVGRRCRRVVPAFKRV